MVFLLLGAGSETTTHLISGSVYELLRNPSLRDWLEEDWSRGNLAIEEFLRFVSPVQFTKPRYVRHDVELGGVRVKKGDGSWPCWRPPTWTRRRTSIPNGSISRDGLTGISRSAPASTSASAISSRASRANVRFRRCSRAGQTRARGSGLANPLARAARAQGDCTPAGRVRYSMTAPGCTSQAAAGDGHFHIVTSLRQICTIARIVPMAAMIRRERDAGENATIR